MRMNRASSTTNAARARTARQKAALGLLGWLAALWLCCAATPTFHASLDRQVAPVGEPVTLDLSFTGGEPDQVPQIPSPPGLQITYLGPSRQVIMVNGRISTTVTHKYTVLGQQPGDYTLPAIQVRVNGQALSSQPLQLKIVRSDPRTQLAYLRLILPEREVFVGEAFTVEVDLCLRDRIENIANVQLSPLQVESCTQLKQSRLPQRTERNEFGQFTVIPVVYTLVAARPGTLSVGPLDCSFVAELAQENGRRDPFAGFGFGVFRFGETRPISLRADAKPIRVLPLPEQDRPPEFNGAVGRFTLSLVAGPTNVAVGDPITVRIQIRGHGVLEALKLPEQPDWHGFKTYPPTENVQTTDPLGIEGTKTFELIVVPQTAGLRALPPLHFAYFDPETRSYHRIATDPVPLQVRAGASTPVPTLASEPAAHRPPPAPARDILGLKQHLGPLATSSPPLLTRPSFWLAQSVPLLAWAALLIWRRRTDAIAADPRRQRQREARRRIRHALREVRNLAASGPPDAFYAALFRLLQEQIAERFDLPASSVTEAVIEERLRPAGLSPDLCRELHDLFQLCNQARYAPGLVDADLPRIRARAETVVQQLRTFPV